MTNVYLHGSVLFIVQVADARMALGNEPSGKCTQYPEIGRAGVKQSGGRKARTGTFLLASLLVLALSLVFNQGQLISSSASRWTVSLG